MPLPNFLLPAHPIARSGHATVALAGAPAASSALPLVMQIQEKSQWCWAAVSSSIKDFYGTGAMTQCAIAGAELGLACCPTNSAAPGCNTPWYLDRALRRVGHLDRMTFASESFTTVQLEVNGGRPLCARIAWAGSGAHFMGLGGWSIDQSGTQYVDVHDPFYGFTTATNASFVSSYRTPGDTWTHSYFTAPTPPAVLAAIAGAPLSA
jgi:hypothetical protein